MSDRLIDEIRDTMDAFFANASDEEFWAVLKEIDEKGYTKIDVPLVTLHEEQAKLAKSYFRSGSWDFADTCFYIEGGLAQ